MDEKECDVRSIHADDRPIIIHDVPYTLDDEGDKLFNAGDVIERYKNGDWDYIDKEPEEAE